MVNVHVYRTFEYIRCNYLHISITYFFRIQKLRDGFLVFFRLNVAALKVVKMNKDAIESRLGLCSMLCT